MALYGLSGPAGGDPLGTFEQMRREMAGLLENWGVRAPTAARSGVYPPVNLYETAEGYVLVAELPGVRGEDLQVSVERNRVSLRGERRIDLPEERATLHRRERQSGVFRRALDLPVEIDADKVQATYRNGVLSLNLPKRPEDRPRQISVNAS